MNVITFPQVFLRFTSFSLSVVQNVTEQKADETPTIQDIFKSLYLNEERNKLIIQDILDAYREGRQCLVLSERLEHLDILTYLLKEHVSSLFVLKGGLGKMKYGFMIMSMRRCRYCQECIQSGLMVIGAWGLWWGKKIFYNIRCTNQDEI